MKVFASVLENVFRKLTDGKGINVNEHNVDFDDNIIPKKCRLTNSPIKRNGTRNV